MSFENELRDRAFIMMDNWESFIVEHKYLEVRPDLKAQSERIFDLLYRFYQDVSKIIVPDNPNIRTVEFEGIPGGDNECFCWHVDEATARRFNQHYDLDREIAQETIDTLGDHWRKSGNFDNFSQMTLERLNQLYFENLFELENKKYRFTIKVEVCDG